MADDAWTITISPTETRFKGFKPLWFENTYPMIGNKGQAGDMKNVSLLDPNLLAPGPKPTDLTNGDENGAVTKLITSILSIPTSSGVGWAAGSNLIFKTSNSSVTDDGTYPMTLDKAAVASEVITDLALYKSKLYFFFNHSGSAGDVAQLDYGTDTLDADWGSTSPTGATTLEDAVHYALNGGDDSLYFTNGQYVGKMADASTIDTQALDFWTDSVVVSLAWNNNRVYALVNRPNVSGSNFNQSGIYRWNGSAPSWEGDPIEVQGRLGASYVKNGTTYIWWEDSPGSNYFNFGYINGSRLVGLTKCEGTLPNQNQVGEYNGHVAWMSDGLIYLHGSVHPVFNVELFQYGSVLHTNTDGAFGTPFGDVLLSSYDGSSQYSLAKLGGYTTDSQYELGPFPMTQAGVKAEVGMIQVETESLASGAQLDFTLTYDKEKSTKTLSSIAYDASDDATLHKVLPENDSVQVEDFRLDLDHSNGSASNPVEVRSIMIKGRWVQNN